MEVKEISVLHAQQGLKQLNYDLGPHGVDGDFGSATSLALKEFLRNKVGPTGTYIIKLSADRTKVGISPREAVFELEAASQQYRDEEARRARPDGSGTPAVALTTTTPEPAPAVQDWVWWALGLGSAVVAIGGIYYMSKKSKPRRKPRRKARRRVTRKKRR